MKQLWTKKPEKYLHSLLLDRIYHEDQLFTQRTYNFTTMNAFLVAAFALSYINGSVLSFAYIIAGFGLLFAFIQISLGKRLEATSNFWREYLWVLEKQIGINFDRAQFIFYNDGKVQIPSGVIVATEELKKPMYQTLPWSIPFFRSVNLLMGVVIPWLIAIFWLLFLLVMLYLEEHYWTIVLISNIFVLLFLTSLRINGPAKPEGHENIITENNNE